MEWTENHDVILCREILVSEPYKFKPRTLERGKEWDEIAERLNNIKDPKFKVSKRSIREHFQLLLSKFKTKMKTEQRASGIEVEDTEVDKAMEETYEKWEASEGEQLKGKENTKKKAEVDKASAEEVRLRVTEKLSETKKRKNAEEGCAVKPKKTRRNGGETVEFLREKSQRDYQFRQEELRIKQKEQENLQSIQQQQLEMMRMLQQQNNAMMLLVSKFVNK